LGLTGPVVVQGYLFGAPAPAEELDFTRYDESRRFDSVA